MIIIFRRNNYFEICFISSLSLMSVAFPPNIFTPNSFTPFININPWYRNDINSIEPYSEAFGMPKQRKFNKNKFHQRPHQNELIMDSFYPIKLDLISPFALQNDKFIEKSNTIKSESKKYKKFYSAPKGNYRMPIRPGPKHVDIEDPSPTLSNEDMDLIDAHFRNFSTNTNSRLTFRERNPYLKLLNNEKINGNSKLNHDDYNGMSTHARVMPHFNDKNPRKFNSLNRYSHEKRERKRHFKKPRYGKKYGKLNKNYKNLIIPKVNDSTGIGTNHNQLYSKGQHFVRSFNRAKKPIVHKTYKSMAKSFDSDTFTLLPDHNKRLRYATPKKINSVNRHYNVPYKRNLHVKKHNMPFKNNYHRNNNERFKMQLTENPNDISNAHDYGNNGNVNDNNNNNNNNTDIGEDKEFHNEENSSDESTKIKIQTEDFNNDNENSKINYQRTRPQFIEENNEENDYVNLYHHKNDAPNITEKIHNQITNDITDVTDVNDDDEEWISSSIPGMPGRDYPTLSSVPITAQFSCKGKPFGYYADIGQKCQVYHQCSPQGLQRFLCPNGTVFNQESFVCEWWYNVNCADSERNYDKNEILYKANATFRDDTDHSYLIGNSKRDEHSNNVNQKFGQNYAFESSESAIDKSRIKILKGPEYIKQHNYLKNYKDISNSK